MRQDLLRSIWLVVTTSLLFCIVLGAISNATLRRQRMWQAMREEHMRRINADRQRYAERRARAEQVLQEELAKAKR